MVHSEELNLLRSVELFGALSDDALHQIASRMTRQRYTNQAVIIQQKQSIDGVYVVASGVVRLAMCADSGRELTVGSLSCGQTLGEAQVLLNQPSAMTAIADGEVHLRLIPADMFNQIVQQYPVVASKLLVRLSLQLNQTTQLVEGLGLYDVPTRLRRTLYKMAHEQGRPSTDGILIQSMPTQQDLANRVGTCRETVSRILSSMARQGLVESRGRSMLVRPQLMTLAAAA